MNAKKCDRCGNYYQLVWETPIETLARTMASVMYTHQLLERIEACVDLCPNCTEELKTWLKGGEFECPNT